MLVLDFENSGNNKTTKIEHWHFLRILGPHDCHHDHNFTYLGEKVVNENE